MSPLSPEERAAYRSRQRSASLVAPADLAGQPELLLDLIDDLVAVLNRYQIEPVYAGPWRLRLTAQGRRRLRAALTARQVDYLGMVSSSVGHGLPKAEIEINFLGTPPGDPAYGVRIGVTLIPDPAWGWDVVTDLADFVQRWFAPLSAASAFVSDNPKDHSVRTHHEHLHHLPMIFSWMAFSRHPRGVFWGMGLGPSICQLLGGREQVLDEAPATIHRPLGEGVWLQLSEISPADPATYEPMADYLGPLLVWTDAEVVLPPSEEAPAPLPAPPEPGPDTLPVPLVVGEVEDGNLPLTVTLAVPLTGAVRQAVDGAVRAWYVAGFEGAYGGAGFHWLSDPVVDVDGGSLAWNVDLGSADPEQAIEALRKWLGAVGQPPVKELILSFEPEVEG